MATFKTIDDIKTDVWDTSVDPIHTFKNFPKKNLKFKKKDCYDITDIEVWEELYYVPGHLGVYAAWSPFVECYIITHNLFLNKPYGIEIFNNQEDVIFRANQLGVILDEHTVWVDNSDYLNFTEI